MTTETDELFTICKHKNHVYIYGAGKNSSDTYLFFRNRNIEIAGFLVSNMCGNPHILFDCPVIDINTFYDESQYLVLVPMFRNTSAYREICDCLISKRIQHVYFFPAGLLHLIKQSTLIQKEQELFNNEVYQLGKHIPVEKDYEILIMKGMYGQEYHWRIPQKMIMEHKFNSICDIFPQKTALEEFEEQYGTYHIFRAKNSINIEKKQIFAVYMAQSHMDRTALPAKLPSWIIPLQVGSALTNKNICLIKDNTGENISERNGNYSECTALYWMWKNAPKVDYIGLCHYRRHFCVNEDEIKEIKQANIDVLVTTPSFVQETAGSFFSTLIPESDTRAMLAAIKKICPEYLSTAKSFLTSRFYPPCNLFIMKYNLFMDYCDFIFSVTFEIENYYNKIDFYRKDRYIGFIIECLLGIFLMKNKEQLKIAYTDMLFYS